MSLIKRYLRKKLVCKVTFRLPRKATESSKNVHVVGDFNEWDSHSIPMKRLKNGDFTATVDLDPSKEYQFRYLKDDQSWENDWDADKYVPSPYGDCDNSVVVV